MTPVKKLPRGDTPIKDLGLSVRTLNALMNMGCVTLDDARVYREPELLRQPNFGRKSLKELLAVTGPIPQRPSRMPMPPIPPPPPPPDPMVVLYWKPDSGLWVDKFGNPFNLWKINR